MSERKVPESREGRGGTTSKEQSEGNVSHDPSEAERPRSWTQEEMEDAAPMPLPEIPDEDPE